MVLTGRMERSSAQKFLEAYGGGGLGICREPTGWGYPASGVAGSFGLRYSQGGTRINGTNLLIDSIPLVAELTGFGLTGRQAALNGLVYRGEGIDKAQRFGLSFADVECQVYEGRLLVQPLLPTPDVPWVTLRARLGLVAGNATLGWLHTVTVTRVYVNRFYLGPSAGFGLESSVGDHIRLQGWVDVLPFVGSSAITRTNEGQTNRIQNFRFSDPAKSLGVYTGASAVYYLSQLGLGKLGVGVQATYRRQTLGVDQPAGWVGLQGQLLVSYVFRPSKIEKESDE